MASDAGITLHPTAGSMRRRIAGFVRLLRDNGFPVGMSEVEDSLTVAAAADLSRPHALRWGLRCLLCASQTDWKRFDELFDAYWLAHGMKRAVMVHGSAQHKPARRLPSAGGPPGPAGLADHVQRSTGVTDDNPASGQGRRGGASTTEQLATTDLRHVVDPDALNQVHLLAERLAARMRDRLTRRERVRRKGRRLDLRGTIHRSIPFGGTPIRLAHRRRHPKPLRLVVILDASGSMSQYSAFFVRFLHGVLDHFRQAEAFVFHTRLIHISQALREKDPAKAIDRMSLIAQGWSGGTRIGESIAAFNRHHAKTVLNSRSVVMIVSDGYDTGSPERLGREMAALKRRARRVVWLNPMLGWPGYEPEAGGMRAALPHIDLFAPAHNLESLAALEPYLARL